MKNLQIQGAAAAPIHQPEMPPAQPSRRFAELFEKFGQPTSEVLIWTGLAALIAGAALFAAVKTWQGWNHEISIDRHDMPVPTIAMSIDGQAGWVGMFPVLFGAVGMVGAGGLFRDKSRRNHAIGLGALSLFACLYGISTLSLYDAVHETIWPGSNRAATWSVTQRHWHLNSGVWPKLESGSIAAMVIPGAVLGAGCAGRLGVYLKWKR
jgi:hypothetical protein